MSELLLLDQSVVDQLRDDVGEDALEMLMTAFRKEISSAAELLRGAFEADDLDQLEIRAHALKSAAATFGAARLSGACLAVETAAREGLDHSTLETHLDTLILAIAATMSAFGWSEEG